MMTQNDALIQHFNSGKKITSLQAHRQGITSLPKRICELVARGYKIKRKPLHDKCEHRKLWRGDYFYPCGKPAKAECYYNGPKFKPMVLCGIHAYQAKRKGCDVRYIGETK